MVIEKSDNYISALKSMEYLICSSVNESMKIPVVDNFKDANSLAVSLVTY